MLSYLHFSDYGEIWLIPPFGATMVLVMAVHNSPLAEPKNIFLGHTLSALSGVVIFALMGASAISLGSAGGFSVFIAILGGKSLSFVLMPVALGAVFIIIFALFYNKLLRRDYP